MGGEFGYLIFRISKFGTLSTGLVEYPCIAYYWLLGSVVTGDLVEFRVLSQQPILYGGAANYRLGPTYVFIILKKKREEKGWFFGGRV